MNKSSIIISILTTLSFVLILISYLNKRDDKGDFDLLRSKAQISKGELTVFNAPGIQGKKVIPLSDRKELDSLNMALGKLTSPVNITIAKENRVYAIIDIYKQNKKTPVGILNAETTGWVLIIGNSTFKSDYIFRLVERHLAK